MTATEPLTVIDPDGSTNGHDPGMSEAELLHCYRTMLRTRVFDETCMKLQRSGRIGFSIPNVGVEATQVGAASALRRTDWIFPSYRDFGMALYHGVTPLEMMHNMYGNSRDYSKGRQMPVHFSFREPIPFVSISSPIGTQIPQAVGAAHAMRYRGEDAVALSSFGDGGTSALGFHSGLNFAGVWKSPVVFLCQNNGYAISCPADEQTASASYAIKAKAYGMPGVQVDGNDLLAVRAVVLEAVERARSGGGPTLIEALTFRMGGHSTSDDPSRYVPKALFEQWKQRDPITTFQARMQEQRLLSDEDLKHIEEEVGAEIMKAVEFAEAGTWEPVEELTKYVYSEKAQT